MAASSSAASPDECFARTLQEIENRKQDSVAGSDIVLLVKLRDVTLLFTLNPKVQQKSFFDAVVAPFCKAYNKKRPDSAVDCSQILRVELDGRPFDELHGEAGGALAVGVTCAELIFESEGNALGGGSSSSGYSSGRFAISCDAGSSGDAGSGGAGSSGDAGSGGGAGSRSAGSRDANLQSSTQQVAKAATDPSAASVAQLVAMGFTEVKAAEALAATDGVVESALTLLLAEA
eukprot:TRINITY_DN14902_c0_g1_i1.p1 TRINITY_DN14902_c0_g1~~TRINITY_DN14902_c0_g1_i1.p1  ORF type:complete len:233 (+),score=44.83 TRINITY_DN14902_c0_g1_i1:142-840(+)